MHIAIIGAGFSGLLSAYLLKKKGVDVTVFEREERSGGQCMTYGDDKANWELGTVCSYTNPIKELLIELGIDYAERFVYKHFVDEEYNRIEHLTREEVNLLLRELEVLKEIIEIYSDSLGSASYRLVHKDLLKPFDEFIESWNLPALRKFILPFLSSFGFGDIKSVQAFYILKIFSLDIINSYLQGGKMLFLKKGTTDLITKLSSQIRDIRYFQDVKRIEVTDHRVLVDTAYSSDLFDKVLITTKLRDDVIRTSPYNDFMKKVETNPYISCAFEVSDCDAVTTYFKGNLGKVGKIQLFRISSPDDRKVLVAYCNGYINQNVIWGISEDIKAVDITIKHLIMPKQWQLFPHIKMEDLTSTLYCEINEHLKDQPLCLIGSLVSIPTLDNLYLSVRQSIEEITSSEHNSALAVSKWESSSM